MSHLTTWVDDGTITRISTVKNRNILWETNSTKFLRVGSGVRLLGLHF